MELQPGSAVTYFDDRFTVVSHVQRNRWRIRHAGTGNEKVVESEYLKIVPTTTLQPTKVTSAPLPETRPKPDAMGQNLIRLLADFDIGPTTCLFGDLLDSRSITPNKATLQFYLGFVQDLKFKAREFAELLTINQEWRVKNPSLHQQLVTYSVAKWIHHTNQLEFAGPTAEEDTLSLITEKSPKPVSIKDSEEVLQTYKLLQDTYSDTNDLSSRTWKNETIQSWHQIMFSGILDSAGQFRESGVETRNPDESQHCYPHHCVIQTALHSLSNLVTKCARLIEESYTADSPERVLYTFALAAFAQFHFTDIHPFLDGNGRMCRFLSKLILDSICPVPFPMFTDRVRYLKTLVEGRVTPETAPLLLTNLLFDSAIEYYSHLHKDHYGKEYSHVLCASTKQDLQHALSTIDIPKEHKEALLKEFKALPKGEYKDIALWENITFRIRKFYDLDIDNL